MVARSDGDILGTGSLDLAHPLGGVETGRIETAGILGIFLIGNVLLMHHPFSLGQHGIHAPVDENTEFIVPELLFGSHDFRRRHIAFDALFHNGNNGALRQAQEGR